MQFTKIKYSNDKVHIEYNIENESTGTVDEFKLTSSDAPKESFKNAFANLVPAIIQICEFNDDYGDSIKPTGLSMSYSNGVMGATITCLKTLVTANAPLVLNTPHLPEEDYSGNNPDAPILPVSAIKAIEILVDEATDFVKGKRQQESLFENTDIELSITTN